jgi:hypothetical protein
MDAVESGKMGLPPAQICTIGSNAFNDSRQPVGHGAIALEILNAAES